MYLFVCLFIYNFIYQCMAETLEGIETSEVGGADGIAKADRGTCKVKPVWGIGFSLESQRKCKNAGINEKTMDAESASGVTRRRGTDFEGASGVTRRRGIVFEGASGVTRRRGRGYCSRGLRQE